MQYIILDGDADVYDDDLEALEEQGKIEIVPEDLPEDTDNAQINDIFSLINKDSKEWQKQKEHTSVID